MGQPPYNVLFPCTGNSARSIMAEAILNRAGNGRFRTCSAGHHPTGQVHPLALKLLKRRGCAMAGLRSKSWDAFMGEDAPELDLVGTVCGQAAQACPVWPARTLQAPQGLPDPAAAGAGAAEARFAAAYAALAKRIDALVALPMQESSVLGRRLSEIGALSADGAHAR